MLDHVIRSRSVLQHGDGKRALPYSRSAAIAGLGQIVSAVLGTVVTTAGEAWERDARPLLTNFNNMYNPCVVETGEPGWKSRQLREAVSTDGQSWRRLDFIPPDDDTDACHVPQALVTKIEGREWLYLLYATQIGYGKNDGKYHYQYDRIRAMRRPIKPSEGADGVGP